MKEISVKNAEILTLQFLKKILSCRESIPTIMADDLEYVSFEQEGVASVMYLKVSGKDKMKVVEEIIPKQEEISFKTIT